MLMTVRAMWAGLRHDILNVLGREEAPDENGYSPAWDPTLPRGSASYGPGDPAEK